MPSLRASRRLIQGRRIRQVAHLSLTPPALLSLRRQAPRDISTATQAHVRTATLVVNDSQLRHSATHSEYRPQFLNGRQRSVNRKVQSPMSLRRALLSC